MLSSIESIIGLKYVATDAVALHIGAGRELIHGVASPDIRAYAGINVTVGPKHGHHTKTMVKRRSQPETKKEEPAIEDFVAETSDDSIVNDPIGNDPFPNLEVTPPKGEETFVINNVFFAFDRFDLVAPGGRDILRRLAVYLYKTPEFKQLVIEGHTDFIGSDAYNKDLSLRRASQIRRYLVEVLRVDASRIQVVGYGESMPIADNGNFQGRQMNRRVEFKILR
jgi:outer membrane protein OmpA-like peptidoglycan-associated protein